MSKKMMSMLLTLLFICLTFFRSGWVWIFRVRLMLTSLNTYLMIARVSIALLPRFAQTLMLFLCHIHREIARLKRRERNNQHVHPAARNFEHRLLIYDSTIIYRCIALIQLLYILQHQSRKLWIPLICIYVHVLCVFNYKHLAEVSCCICFPSKVILRAIQLFRHTRCGAYCVTLPRFLPVHFLFRDNVWEERSMFFFGRSFAIHFWPWCGVRLSPLYRPCF
jgi:hypothetical protein